jgi:hypothetical protein
MPLQKYWELYLNSIAMRSISNNFSIPSEFVQFLNLLMNLSKKVNLKCFNNGSNQEMMREFKSQLFTML